MTPKEWREIIEKDAPEAAKDQLLYLSFVLAELEIIHNRLDILYQSLQIQEKEMEVSPNVPISLPEV